MRRTWRIAGPLFVLLLAAPVSAEAPLDQYKPFTQRATVIEDAYTKLKWDRAVLASSNYATARDTLCAFPRRIPTLKELLTLVDEDVHKEYDPATLKEVEKAIDERAFPNTPVDVPYWTSTEEGATAWTVSFSTGEAARTQMADVRRVRCVLP